MCAMWDDGEDNTGAIDKIFDEVDELVALAKKSIEEGGKSKKRYNAGLEEITFMMEEVPSCRDFEIDQQADGKWVARVEYHGILFEHVAGTVKPAEWEEILGNDDDDDDDE